MKTKIYMAAHEAFNPPAIDGYCPIQVGSALHDSLGYLRDDTGDDNISEKNPYYSELTALYWMWKNNKEADNLGLVHYRRFFLDDNKRILTPAQAEEILESADIILPEILTMEQGTIESQFVELHHPEDLQVTREAIHKLYPEYEADFIRVLSGNKTYCCNMMIASRELVNDYASWLFDILFEAERHLDISGYDTYNKRIYGFLSERLLTVYVMHHHLKAHELVIGATEEKAETREYIAEINTMIENRQYEEGYQRMLEILNSRPDAFLPNSDIHNRLTHRWYLLNIKHMETQGNMPSGIWDEGLSVDELILHLSALQGHLRRLSTSRADEAVTFISTHHISLMMIRVLFDMMHFTDEQKLHILANAAEGLMSFGERDMAVLFAGYAAQIGQNL